MPFGTRWIATALMLTALSVLPSAAAEEPSGPAPCREIWFTLQDEGPVRNAQRVADAVKGFLLLCGECLFDVETANVRDPEDRVGSDVACARAIAGNVLSEEAPMPATRLGALDCLGRAHAPPGADRLDHVAACVAPDAPVVVLALAQSGGVMSTVLGTYRQGDEAIVQAAATAEAGVRSAVQKIEELSASAEARWIQEQVLFALGWVGEPEQAVTYVVLIVDLAIDAGRDLSGPVVGPSIEYAQGAVEGAVPFAADTTEQVIRFVFS